MVFNSSSTGAEGWEGCGSSNLHVTGQKKLTFFIARSLLSSPSDRTNFLSSKTLVRREGGFLHEAENLFGAHNGSGDLRDQLVNGKRKTMHHSSSKAL